jgi:hypothetical protein
MRKAHDALGVIAKTPAIRAFLEANDPQALAQVDEALADLEAHADRPRPRASGYPWKS